MALHKGDRVVNLVFSAIVGVQACTIKTDLHWGLQNKVERPSALEFLIYNLIDPAKELKGIKVVKQPSKIRMGRLQRRSLSNHGLAGKSLCKK
jgi:hypothetical protein